MLYYHSNSFNIMAQTETINSHQLGTGCYAQLAKHTHYNYLYLNLLKRDPLPWTNIRINIFELQTIQKSASIVNDYIESGKPVEDFPPIFLRSKFTTYFFSPLYYLCTYYYLC